MERGGAYPGACGHSFVYRDQAHSSAGMSRDARGDEPAPALRGDRCVARGGRMRRASRGSSKWIGESGRASRSPRCASGWARKCATTRRAASTSGRRAAKVPVSCCSRVKTWLKDVAQAGKPTLAITHRGVIRALLAEATGWDMRGKPPARLDWSAVHLFSLDAEGVPRIERLNAEMKIFLLRTASSGHRPLAARRDSGAGVRKGRLPGHAGERRPAGRGISRTAAAARVERCRVQAAAGRERQPGGRRLEAPAA